jgi:rubrerythrin
MKEFTIREIIEYAGKIEAESHKFYSQAAEIVKEESTALLLRDLAEEETNHFNHLRELIDEKKVSSSELDTIIANDLDLENRKVKNENITENSTSEDILEIALGREINTEELYKMYLTFTNLPENVIKVFEDLRYQEIGHQNRIKTLMSK